jgi:pre-rRNA-processing protein RIX1
MTYQYQSLVRDITTPTLPIFVSSCLSLISAKSSARAIDVPYLLVEIIFESFCVLIPRHPTIFRPYGNQIKVVIRPYLAPTLSDGYFVPLSLSQSARRVAVLLYQTAAKNTSGEEWGKSVRALVRDIHGTVDQVYRAVIEDWESTAGYVSQTVDVNQEVQGGAKSENDLSAWNGIDAGVQRLEGMLKLLKEHFIHHTATAVNIPLDLVVDLLTRLMSVVPPTNATGGSGYNGVRLHPAIERNERDGLWAALENVHMAAMEVYLVLVNRLQHNFTSLAQRCLSQVAWIFSSRPHEVAFRCVIYQLTAKILPLCGFSLDRPAVALLTPVIRACCKDLPMQDGEHQSRAQRDAGNPPRNESSANVNTFLNNKTASETLIVNNGSGVLEAAGELLPLFLSHLPQQHLQGYLRAKIDRTAILAHHKEAMLASVLNPYLGKNGKTLPSILPHICREFPNDPAVEVLLRPRLPVLRQNQAISQDQQLIEESLQEADDLMEDVVVHSAAFEDTGARHIDTQKGTISSTQATDDNDRLLKFRSTASHDPWGGASNDRDAQIEPIISRENFSSPLAPLAEPSNAKLGQTVPEMEEEEEEDSDESVHLIMDLSDSEDESVS